MNARPLSRTAAFGLMLLASAVPAWCADWTSRVVAPWADPLLARPPILDTGKTLPGDARPLACAPRSLSATLSLPDAIDLALCNSPQVSAAWAAIKVQAAQVGEARAAYLPTLTAGFSRQSQRSSYPEAQFEVQRQVRGDSRYLSLTWRLVDFGGRDASRRLADAALDAALASHDAALQKLMTTVVGLYFDAQTAQAARSARARMTAAARQTLEAALRRELRGAASRTDVLQADTALAKAELEESRAVATHEKALVALSAALGTTTEQLSEPMMADASEPSEPDPAERLSLQEWLELTTQQHPTLQAARAQATAARERVAVIASEGLPTLDLTRSEYANGRPNQALASTRTRESTTALTFNVPLFEGFGRTYKVRGAQAQLEVREAELRELELQLRGDVARAHADALASMRNMAAAARLLRAARESLVAVGQRYERGAADIVDLLAAQSAWADAQQEQVRAVSEARSARLRILANAGVLGLRALER